MVERLRIQLSRAPAALWWIVAGSLAVRLIGFAYVYLHNGLEPFTFSDSRGYLQLAQSLWNTHAYATMVNGVSSIEIFRTPGLPALLAPFATGTFLPLMLYPVLISIVAGALLPLLTYKLAVRMVTRQSALIAAALVSFEPNLIFYTWALLTEMPFVLLALGGLCLALSGDERASWAHLSLGGILLGLSLYMRPGFLPVFMVILVSIAVIRAIRSPRTALKVAVVAACMLLTLSPWAVRMHAVTGVYAIGGVGWRNVYTDYVASIRSVENGTGFSEEKNTLKRTASQYGIPANGYNNPANSVALRKASLSQVLAHKLTTVRLEAFVLFSFFTNDNYYYLFVRHGFIPQTTGHISATYEVLTHGIGAVPTLLHELARQYFIPVIGRAVSIGLVVLAVIGFCMIQSRLKYLFVSLIFLTAIISTVSGLGVQSRFRVPVMPLIFILAAPPLAALAAMRKKRV